MATEEVKNETNETKDAVTNNKGKGLLQVPEVRMLFYVIPVALVLVVIALLLT